MKSLNKAIIILSAICLIISIIAFVVCCDGRFEDEELLTWLLFSGFSAVLLGIWLYLFRHKIEHNDEREMYGMWFLIIGIITIVCPISSAVLIVSGCYFLRRTQY